METVSLPDEFVISKTTDGKQKELLITFDSKQRTVLFCIAASYLDNGMKEWGEYIYLSKTALFKLRYELDKATEPIRYKLGGGIEFARTIDTESDGREQIAFFHFLKREDCSECQLGLLIFLENGGIAPKSGGRIALNQEEACVLLEHLNVIRARHMLAKKAGTKAYWDAFLNP